MTPHKRGRKVKNFIINIYIIIIIIISLSTKSFSIFNIFINYNIINRIINKKTIVTQLSKTSICNFYMQHIAKFQQQVLV